MRYQVILEGRGDLEEWRNAARAYVCANIRPEYMEWVVEKSAPDLFSATERQHTPVLAHLREHIFVPPAFLKLAEAAICHTAPDRFDTLYKVLFHLQDDRFLLNDRSNSNIARLHQLANNVRRDSHKMKAFVRFREVPNAAANRRRFVAWFEPDHFIVERTAPFFQKRFTDMDWLIASPKGTAAWDGTTLKTSRKPSPRPEATDQMDELWQTYFANIFNPARLKLKAMQSEMPKKYWKNMPEAALIPELIEKAEARVRNMHAAQAKQPPTFHQRLQEKWKAEGEVPSLLSPFEQLQHQAAQCTACSLHCNATQTVFGEGATDASIMFVGEQPGDHEDLTGRPFVGPAGELFDQALNAAGIDRLKIYVTNAVKHFKHIQRGKRRLHERPNTQEIEHCRWWLAKELGLVQPNVVVAMGATAYLSLSGERKPIAEIRGAPIPMANNIMMLVTTHPAAILRMPDKRKQEKMREIFVQDIRAATHLCATLPARNLSP
ncbi:DNA polymerase [Maritalea mobilis]|uniref:Type-4 uracil-DNA glycosylase n=1 Tax=Maritalea mobilis TaxID=483324 RepID=A0A4R6W2R2_9HYPH|nr:UdgX family uracil-DNA binding protein [Maritalea mobilis]TDQ67275.1 DNA polymerase [Maritalea mobilis]